LTEDQDVNMSGQTLDGLRNPGVKIQQLTGPGRGARAPSSSKTQHLQT
jgi:hypothetical protein